MWCWRRVKKIDWSDRVRNGEVLLRVKKERNILRTIKRQKANWIGHILRMNCLLKYINERKTEERKEVTRRRGRRFMQLLDDLKKSRGHWELKEELLDRTLWRTRCRKGYSPVGRQTRERTNPATCFRFSKNHHQTAHKIKLYSFLIMDF